MRADRLIAILLELQARGRTSSRKLAASLEVSERTIHRDMEALSTAGIPVYAERGPQGGWELAEGYRTNLTAMNRTEILALVFATAVSPAGTPGFRKDFAAAVTRLLASMPPAYRREAELVRERIHIDGASWFDHNSADGQDLLATLQEAVWSCERLQIRYRSPTASAGAASGATAASAAQSQRTRTVQPLGLIAKQQTWYLAAATPDGLRSFRVSRIESVRATGKTFTRPKGFDLPAFWENSVREFHASWPEYRVRLLLKKTDRSQAYLRGVIPVRIQKESPARRRRGWVEIEADFETPETARAFLAGTGETVEVIAPKALRASLRETGERLRDLYQR